MKHLYNIFIILSLVFICQSANSKITCPTVEELKNTGVGKNVHPASEYTNWSVTGKFNYGTNREWEFTIWVPANEARDSDEAITKAAESLKTFFGTPYHDVYESVYFCLYNVGKRGYSSQAVTQIKRDLY